jgi:hypothetical protein
MDKYYDWMNNKLRQESPLNKCKEWTDEMHKQFPELKRVRGYVWLQSGLKRPHWWLVTEQKQILDPTGSQFLMGYYGINPIRDYEPFDESKGEPHGTCMNCGELSWYSASACSRACEGKLEQYYGPIVSQLEV